MGASCSVGCQGEIVDLNPFHQRLQGVADKFCMNRMDQIVRHVGRIPQADDQGDIEAAVDDGALARQHAACTQLCDARYLPQHLALADNARALLRVARILLPQDDNVLNRIRQ
jgi:hypothetical protein